VPGGGGCYPRVIAAGSGLWGISVRPDEIKRVERYLQRSFGNQALKVVKRANKDDSAEVLNGDEFIGVVFRDDEDGEISYSFNMSILSIDLEG
jgi:hypothetical protein